jgi:hypothetical protein
MVNASLSPGKSGVAITTGISVCDAAEAAAGARWRTYARLSPRTLLFRLDRSGSIKCAEERSMLPCTFVVTPAECRSFDFTSLRCVSLRMTDLWGCNKERKTGEPRGERKTGEPRGERKTGERRGEEDQEPHGDRKTSGPCGRDLERSTGTRPARSAARDSLRACPRCSLRGRRW